MREKVLGTPPQPTVGGNEKLYLAVFLSVVGVLLFLGRDLLPVSILVTWGLTFGGTTAVAVLLVLLYRFRSELRASRHELARKEAELNFARTVQKALFPHHLPQGKGLEFSAVCIPAAGVSGDYYDVLQLSDGRLAFAIADISGKGISAAILMANLQALLRILAGSNLPPSAVCKELNRHLHQVMDSARFATFFYADWHPGEKTLRYVNAGHNSPIMLNGNGSHRLWEGGIPLGIFPSYDFEMGEVQLKPHDVLILYSDGITEAGENSGEEFGETRLGDLVAANRNKPLAEIQNQILAAVTNWSGVDPEDDMTLVIIRATGT